MTTPTGQITLGNVAGELGIGLPLTLGDPRVRALAGVPSGPITLGQCRGKTNGTATAPVHPAAGTLLSQFCVDTTLYGRYANGSGGTYDTVIEHNSPTCGYVVQHPHAGQKVSEYCSGVALYYIFTDGKGGTYHALIDATSAQCGYVAYPAYGTPLYQYCTPPDSGEGGGPGNLVQVYANGSGGEYSEIIEYSSPQCWGAPPPGSGADQG